MEELRKAIAFLFKRKGRESLTDKDFVMSASMDLRWFPPKDAQRFLQIALDSKLIVPVDGKFKPAFEIDKVDVPIDYAPPTTLLQIEATSLNLFNRIVDKITAATNLEKKQVISIINSTQDELDVEIEVAALIVGQDVGVDISGFIDEAEKEVMSRLR